MVTGLVPTREGSLRISHLHSPLGNYWIPIHDYQELLCLSQFDGLSLLALVRFDVPTARFNTYDRW
jgi:hypothetical protein